MPLKQIDYGTLEYIEMLKLRTEILRKPLGLTFSAEDLESDKLDFLIAAFDEEEILGCCILSPIDTNTLQLRQMAVKKKLQGTGIGDTIINFAENIARDKGYKTLMMHARNSAIGFYEKFGYTIAGSQFYLLNDVPHHIMEKPLR